MDDTAGVDAYFQLNPDCFLVRGGLRGALYNLGTGDVYSIDPVAMRVVEMCEAGKPVAEIAAVVAVVSESAIRDFLQRMVGEKMGGFSEQGGHVEKVPLDPPPRKLDFLWLELREDCNLRCRHCYCMSKPAAAAVDRLTHAEWKRVLEEGAELGCREMQFIGGEPLLYGEGLFDLAVHARALGYEQIEIFSNLTFLKDEWVDRIVELRIKVACSVYAARAEIHDLVTTMPGSFERTMDAVRRLKARGVQPRFATTVMKQNQDHLDETQEFLKEMGSPMSRLDLVRPSGRGNDAEIYPDKYSKKKAYRTSAEFLKTNKADFLKRYSGNGCWKGKVAVSSTGDANPCIMQRDNEAGNVRQAPLREIVERGLRKYWDLGYDKVEVCRDCEYRYACTDCRTVAYGLTGELTAKSLHCSYDPYQGEWVDVE